MRNITVNECSSHFLTIYNIVFIIKTEAETEAALVYLTLHVYCVDACHRKYNFAGKAYLSYFLTIYVYFQCQKQNEAKLKVSSNY